MADVPGYAARPDNAVGRKTFGTWLFRQSWPSPASDKSRAQRCTAIRRAEIMSRDPANAGAVAFKRRAGNRMSPQSSAVVFAANRIMS